MSAQRRSWMRGSQSRKVSSPNDPDPIKVSYRLSKLHRSPAKTRLLFPFRMDARTRMWCRISKPRMSEERVLMAAGASTELSIRVQVLKFEVSTQNHVTLRFLLQKIPNTLDLGTWTLGHGRELREGSHELLRAADLLFSTCVSSSCGTTASSQLTLVNEGSENSRFHKPIFLTCGRVLLRSALDHAFKQPC